MEYSATPHAEPSAQELRFVFRSGRLCLAFCATVGERWRRDFERLHIPEDLGRWYAMAGVVDGPLMVTTAELDAARTLREAVYRTAKAILVGQPLSRADEGVINQAAAVAPPVPRMRHGMVTLTAIGIHPAENALSAVARDAIDLFTATNIRRLRECASPECGLLFFDTSRPGRRRWCSSSACGSKTRTATYRQRHTKHEHK